MSVQAPSNVLALLSYSHLASPSGEDHIQRDTLTQKRQPKALEAQNRCWSGARRWAIEIAAPATPRAPPLRPRAGVHCPGTCTVSVHRTSCADEVYDCTSHNFIKVHAYYEFGKNQAYNCVSDFSSMRRHRCSAEQLNCAEFTRYVGTDQLQRSLIWRNISIFRSIQLLLS